MNKFVVILIIVFSMCLTGCSIGGKKHTVTSEEIELIVQQKDIFKEYDLDITDVEIFKQQTNLDDKEDFVFVNVKGQNEDFMANRNYKIIYNLYNDGWKYEEIEQYSDENHFNETIPLHGVDLETLKETFEENDTFFVGDFNEASYQFSQIENVEKDTYREVYKQVRTYEYKYFTDSIEMIAVCEWRDTYWDIKMQCNSNLKLNKSAYGSYSAVSNNEMFGTSRVIYMHFYEEAGQAYYWTEYTETTRVWGTSTNSAEGICELSYRDADTLSNLTGLSGKYVLINPNDNFTLAIFPSGIYFGNTLLKRN